MFDVFEMASSLESVSAELEKARALLVITLEEVFESAEKKYMSNYIRNFEYVIEAALDKIIAQDSVVIEISNILYNLNSEIKRMERKVEDE